MEESDLASEVSRVATNILFIPTIKNSAIVPHQSRPVAVVKDYSLKRLPLKKVNHPSLYAYASSYENFLFPHSALQLTFIYTYDDVILRGKSSRSCTTSSFAYYTEYLPREKNKNRTKPVRRKKENSKSSLCKQDKKKKLLPHQFRVDLCRLTRVFFSFADT